ncbi:MAG: PEGA domain-containing protein [Gammaproteobacteria bacterium]|nr:PEGA domain-containing protein [Gammaproteobacteria bacterium]MBU1723900.1 PEGA domain-containing protein [Gammaproteobacteria bacterium]MBU2006191.1 PEGA domain-containing protein [Gammaproteobacteria bacterium]
MLNKLPNRLAIGVCLMALAGCATVTRGTNVSLLVESEPSGAEVRLSTGQTGTTPSTFSVKRSEPLVVTINKPGYETATISVTPQIADSGAAGAASNAFAGFGIGIIGAGVDVATGAIKELKPNPVKVTLTPQNYYSY